MENISSSEYNDVIHAYSMLLEQLGTGKVDKQFFQYVSAVYSFAQIAGEDMREQMAAEIYGVLKEQDNVGVTFSVFSFLLRLDAKAEYLEEFLQKLRSLQKICSLEWEIADYYYRQLNQIRLKQPQCDTENVRIFLSELARRGVTSCMRRLNVPVRPVPFEERNTDRAVVLTEEFLEDGSEHMEQVLECCYELQHTLGKKVLLVNTAEAASKVGEVSFFGPEYGIVDEGLGKKSHVKWREEEFDFFQCGDFFSELKTAEGIIEKILDYHPGMVFHIGNFSFLAGIIDEWMPVMSIGGVYGRYAVSGTEFQAAFESKEEFQQEFASIAREFEETIGDERNLRLRLVFPADFFQDENRIVPHYEEGTWETYSIHPGRKKLWAVELGMLKEVIRICEKYGIHYFAYKGTLLGAVNRQGFFPWDYDIDLAMKREDYEKFAEVAPKELEERYCLMDGSFVPQWEEFKIQILCRADVKELLEGKKKFTVFPAPPSVHIAILDYLPAQKKEKERQQEILRDIFELMFRIDYNGELAGHSVLEFEKLKQSLGYNINETASVKNQLVQLQQLVSGWCEADKSAGLFQSIDYYNGRRQCWRSFQAEWFEEEEQVPFENQTIPAPRQYSPLLEVLYGNSWQEERCTIIQVDEEVYMNLDKSLYNEEELLKYKRDFFEEEKLELHFTGCNIVGNFFIEKKMKCAWAASIKVLKEVERVCKRNGLLYFVDWGTLLGTVRHKGFIPWDDDIDIAMKREDYNRFREIAETELPAGYCLVDEVFNEGWTTNVSRVINVPDLHKGFIVPHTEKEEEFFGCPYIIGIDIYILDHIPLDKEEADLQMDLFANAIKLKYDLRDNGNKVTREIRDRAKAMEKACNFKFKNDSTILSQSLKLIGAISQLYGPEDGDELGYMYTRFQSRRIVYRKEWFESSVSLPFETTTVEVPKEYMKVIMVEVGVSWKVGYRGGASHDYPFYKKQERDLEKQGIVIS